MKKTSENNFYTQEELDRIMLDYISQSAEELRFELNTKQKQITANKGEYVQNFVGL